MRLTTCFLSVICCAALFLTGCSKATRSDDRALAYKQVEVDELKAALAAAEQTPAPEATAPVADEPAPEPSLSDDLAGTGVVVSERDGAVIVTVGNEILFRPGSAQLSTAAGQALRTIADALKQRYPGRPLSVDGHTDNEPIRRSKDKWSDNWDLAAARAHAVLLALVEAGIPAGDLRLVSYGEYRPVADNASRSGRESNRRVEIIVLP
jgi:flagellar motor protein MotB